MLFWDHLSNTWASWSQQFASCGHKRWAASLTSWGLPPGVTAGACPSPALSQGAGEAGSAAAPRSWGGSGSCRPLGRAPARASPLGRPGDRLRDRDGSPTASAPPHRPLCVPRRGGSAGRGGAGPAPQSRYRPGGSQRATAAWANQRRACCEAGESGGQWESGRWAGGKAVAVWRRLWPGGGARLWPAAPPRRSSQPLPRDHGHRKGRGRDNARWEGNEGVLGRAEGRLRHGAAAADPSAEGLVQGVHEGALGWGGGAVLAPPLSLSHPQASSGNWSLLSLQRNGPRSWKKGTWWLIKFRSTETVRCFTYYVVLLKLTTPLNSV